MTNTTLVNNLYGIANGNTTSNAFVDHFADRDPTPQDVAFPIQKKWLNTSATAYWELQNFVTTNGIITANWVRLTSAVSTEQLEGNTGGPVSPDGSNIIHVIGDTTTVNVVGTPLSNTLTISASSSVPTTFVEDSGSATPVANILNIVGGSGISTSGSGNTVTISSTASGPLSTLTGNSGGAVSPTGGNIDTVGTGSITIVGNPGTSTLTTQLTGLTDHNVLIGAGTATITNVAPSATSGVPLISQGAAADPTFGTAVVAGGGTGNISFTTYAVICGGTTTTNPLQSIASVGTSGQVLTSNGAGALPTFQNTSASSAFTSIVIQNFTSSGTYTPTSGMKYCIVECQGAGGGGGGCSSTGPAQVSTGGGGGGGGYSRKVFSAATIGASQIVTIGAGGIAGSSGGGNGGTGGTTSLGALLSATGAEGGNGAAAAASSFENGGIPGGGLSGDLNIFGTAGGLGWGLVSFPNSNANNGPGGDSYFGTGGRQVTNTLGVVGQNGRSFGGGGAGSANSINQASGHAGGTGADGVIVITEFIS